MRSDTQVMPLVLDIPFQDFVSIYREANLCQIDRTFNSLYKAMQPTFLFWEDLWSSQDYSSNVNISSLINILVADNSPSGSIDWKLDTYNAYLELNNLSLVDELNYCLVEHVRKDKHIYDRYYEEKNLLFFIAKDIKMFLFKKIRKVLSNYKRCGGFKISYEKPTVSYDFIIDTSYLSVDKLSNNIFFLLLQEVQVADIMARLQVSHKLYKESIECLLQNLKQLSK